MTEPERHHHHHFFVDGTRYETDQNSLTGAQIKAQANVPAAYQLFLEVKGDQPDKAISDGEAVDVEHQPKHFYAVPPATFGAR